MGNGKGNHNYGLAFMSMLENENVTLRNKMGNWLESMPVRYFIISLILLNAVTLGMETAPRLVQQYGNVLQILDKTILSVFVAEMALKLYAFDWRFFKNGWNVFDLIIIAIALMPSSGVLSVLRSLRILRVLRLISLLPQLRFVVEALLKAIPGISSIFVLLFLLHYVFAVIATRLYGQEFPEWFGTLGISMYTLFQIMTLEGWADITRAVMEKFSYAWLFFIIFILTATFSMLNLFVAIIVDTMQTLREHQQEETCSTIEATTLSEAGTLREDIRALRTEIGELKALVTNNKQ